MFGQHLADFEHMHAQFFIQLAAGGLQISLARFHLAARELPELAMAMVGRPLGDQVAAIGLDHCGDDPHGRVYHQAYP